MEEVELSNEELILEKIKTFNAEIIDLSSLLGALSNSWVENIEKMEIAYIKFKQMSNETITLRKTFKQLANLN